MRPRKQAKVIVIRYSSGVQDVEKVVCAKKSVFVRRNIEWQKNGKSYWILMASNRPRDRLVSLSPTLGVGSLSASHRRRAKCE